jgi:hypothetical protein
VDVFAYWMQSRGVEFMTALVQLADRGGVPVPESLRDGRMSQPAVRMARAPVVVREEELVPPELPPLRRIRDDECLMLGCSRGLDEGAIMEARERRMIAACVWPQWRSRHDGTWAPRSQGAWPSWCAIDDTLAVAEYRRLDGGMYARADGSEIKAWSTRGKNWPLGAASLGARLCALLVEGGPDMLAGFHFLRRFGMLDRVGVVCMLGAANRIRESALGRFRGLRVRIMMDADDHKGDGRAPGLEAAARWQEDLCGAGAAVETFSLYGLTMPDGRAVKDLNDLARCDDGVTTAREIREAFCAWDF